MNTVSKSKKIAIVYDWIDKWGGVERILLTLHKLFPQAVFYTSYTNLTQASWAKQLPVKTSFIQSLPNFIRSNRILSLPFYPLAFESFDFTDFDLVISVTSSFAKAVITKPPTKHICYLLSPTRYFWGMEKDYLKSGWKRLMVSPFTTGWRQWDYIVAQRPDLIVSLSKTVADRCQKYYRRASTVVYPPFDVDYWQGFKQRRSELKDQRFFLVVSRLEPYKKIDLVIDVFNQLVDQRLVVVGEGSQKRYLQAMAGNNSRFTGQVTDQELASLYSQARALIIPQEEDFGYVSLEAQFFGCPVVAYAVGGTSETVVDGKTGILFAKQSPESLRNALARYHTLSYNLKIGTITHGKKNVERFRKEAFFRSFQNLVDGVLSGDLGD
ncbi:hypothetical protein A2966_04520 [Candidatus Roizmanbacteria bacterium RIFCSPLOWO2_01_FULL_41_22]|uniref:Glycosyl transferase family 1 domain-containing protein n=1 Tax=Candidatus Roizmanbacteria bacterium RIFCSPLOWO2_01_FULL_41_22 TaxID=1802067 RepID=A0A1F7J6Y2_9BACT|nr:MAG: hypothetical protein A2966_04520 [Candidatus Roizmanbacteria bacterium RIFCSPLOWO2_01_FULL_41_22]